MRKVTILTAVLALGVTATGAGYASGKSPKMPERVKKRSVYEGYNYASFSSDDGLEHRVLESIEIDTKKSERWASVTVHDASGLSAPAEIGQDHDGDGTLDETWRVCGSSESPRAIHGGHSLFVTVEPGDCNGSTAPTTYGLVQVDLFSPAPPRKPKPSVEKVERTISTTYYGPLLYANDELHVSGGAWRTDSWASERFVSVKFEDQSGLPVHFFVGPEDEPGHEFCGEMDKPLAIPSGAEVFVWIHPAPCADGTPSAATTGTVEVTYSNLR